MNEAWLAMLIYRSTDIPGLNKSPAEILNGRRYRTGLPVIDVRSKELEIEIEKLAENRSKMAITDNGRKELPKLPVGTEIMYEGVNSTQMQTKINDLSGVKAP